MEDIEIEAVEQEGKQKFDFNSFDWVGAFGGLSDTAFGIIDRANGEYYKQPPVLPTVQGVTPPTNPTSQTPVVPTYAPYPRIGAKDPRTGAKDTSNNMMYIMAGFGALILILGVIVLTQKK